VKVKRLNLHVIRETFQERIKNVAIFKFNTFSSCVSPVLKIGLQFLYAGKLESHTLNSLLGGLDTCIFL
jgi:hypothetical protein